MPKTSSKKLRITDKALANSQVKGSAEAKAIRQKNAAKKQKAIKSHPRKKITKEQVAERKAKSDKWLEANKAKKAGEAKKASNAARAVKKGQVVKKSRKVRHSVQFRRPHTLRLGKKPQYPRKSYYPGNARDEFKTLLYPLTTEPVMKKIEDDNTLVFIVDVKSTKASIKDAVRRMYDVKALKVNTLIRPDGKKKAYVRLTADYDALDVASKIGII
eukprot:CAMPEP_0168589404 /NCGR_PEP_ID=MMETSP0420-20121227/5994_1 /TAXON_ID=498008 /ORGANISM="Pessonella sp." /LENGTH=215 /DNA_ID=CAMNT_0008624949 /DNA_START=46 /DNA_END=693 /DNA_ORIENTATION=+